jgi:hypothetical protein
MIRKEANEEGTRRVHVDLFVSFFVFSCDDQELQHKHVVDQVAGALLN